MDKSMEAFVERQNVMRYIDHLKTETDPAKRDFILKILAEEEAKQIKAGTPTGWIGATGKCPVSDIIDLGQCNSRNFRNFNNLRMSGSPIPDTKGG